MDHVEKNYSQIKEITGEGITFTDGQSIAFGDCIKRRYDSEKCTAERNICAKPPYFEFLLPVSLSGSYSRKTGFFRDHAATNIS